MASPSPLPLNSFPPAPAPAPVPGLFDVLRSPSVLTLVTATLYMYQALFGFFRRRCTNPFFKYTLWAACTLTFTIAAYTYGQLQTSPHKPYLYEVLTISLLTFVSSPHSLTAFQLADNKQWLSHLTRQLLSYGYVIVTLRLIASYSFDFKPKAEWAIVTLGTFTTMANLVGQSSYLLTNSCIPDKFVADYMSTAEAESNAGHGYPTILCHNYRYLLFLLGSYDDQFEGMRGVTIEEVWSYQRELLQSERGEELSYLCLSYAMFILLRRRYFGLVCAEAKSQKALDYVTKVLLLDVEIAFKVLDMELGFLYDYFFTRYPHIMNCYFKGRVNLSLLYITIKLIMVPILCLFVLKKAFQRDDSEVGSREREITCVVLGMIFFSDLFQLLSYKVSDWEAVRMLCQPRLISSSKLYGYRKWLLIFRSRVPRLKYWRDKLGQCSLFDDKWINFGTIPLVLMHTFVCGIFPCYYGGRTTFLLKARHIRLSKELKKAIASTFIDNEGQLIKFSFVNGMASACRNELELFTWRSGKDNYAETIIVWHIATRFCDIANHDNTSRSTDREIAIQISRYCMYLMVEHPTLLPGHIVDTSKMLREVVHDSSKVFKGATSNDAKYSRMQDLPETANSILRSGVQLGQELGRIDDVQQRWKLIVKFWTEMILFIAP